MKFYGSGVLRYPGTSRTVHDFEDGPFDTVNPDIIRHALNMGFTTVPPPEPVKIEPEQEKPIIEPAADGISGDMPEPPAKAKRGRKPKAVKE